MASIYMKNEITGDVKQIDESLNWKVFFFGWIYLFYKGDIGSGIALMAIDIAIATMTTVAASDYVPYLLFAILIAHIIVANNWHKAYIKVLEKKDYKIIEQ
jgi:hypothetical protein